MRILLITALALFTFANVKAQEMNKTVLDEKSGTQILVGFCDRVGLESSEMGGAMQEARFTFKPDNASMEALKYKLDSITFTVVLGTWCGDTKEWVPRFVKFLDCVKYDVGLVTFIAVDRKKEAGEVPTKDLKIDKVPTFIVYKANKEIGRIVETPEMSVEQDLVKIILP
jgi:hypothetical protein